MPFYPCPRERSGRSVVGRQEKKNPLIWVSVVFRVSLAHPPPRPEAQIRGFFLLGYTALGNESNSDASGKCYWWLWSATARREVAKIVPLTERLSNVQAPKSSIKGA